MIPLNMQPALTHAPHHLPQPPAALVRIREQQHRIHLLNKLRHALDRKAPRRRRAVTRLNRTRPAWFAGRDFFEK